MIASGIVATKVMIKSFEKSKSHLLVLSHISCSCREVRRQKGNHIETVLFFCFFYLERITINKIIFMHHLRLDKFTSQYLMTRTLERNVIEITHK